MNSKPKWWWPHRYKRLLTMTYANDGSVIFWLQCPICKSRLLLANSYTLCPNTGSLKSWNRSDLQFLNRLCSIFESKGIWTSEEMSNTVEIQVPDEFSILMFDLCLVFKWTSFWMAWHRSCFYLWNTGLVKSPFKMLRSLVSSFTIIP